MSIKAILKKQDSPILSNLRKTQRTVFCYTIEIQILYPLEPDKTAFPETSSGAVGLAVPIPTRLFVESTFRVLVSTVRTFYTSSPRASLKRPLKR
jgi:hypothetical protein